MESGKGWTIGEGARAQPVSTERLSKKKEQAEDGPGQGGRIGD